MLKRTFFAFFLFCCTLGFASDPVNTHDALLTQIGSNDCECVVNVTDDKIYVNPERIFPTSQGLFLHIRANEYVALPLLFSDDQGCFIKAARISSPCKQCGEERLSGAFKCPNAKCPSNQPKPKKK